MKKKKSRLLEKKRESAFLTGSLVSVKQSLPTYSTACPLSWKEESRSLLSTHSRPSLQASLCLSGACAHTCSPWSWACAFLWLQTLRRGWGRPQNLPTGGDVPSLDVTMAEPHSCPCLPVLLPSQEADHASLPGPALAGRGQRAPAAQTGRGTDSSRVCLHILQTGGVMQCLRPG